jgi:hypothetical protein
MSKTPAKGTYVLGHQQIEHIMERLEEWLRSIKLSDTASEKHDDWTFGLGLFDPMRSLSWRPAASNQRYVLLEWTGGADRSDGFLQLVRRTEIEKWPERLQVLAKW